MMRFAHLDNPAAAYIAILLRDLYNAKAFGKISRKKHVIVCLDEVNKYCDRLKSSSSREMILKLIDLSASERMSIWSSSQDHKRIPIQLIEQSRYVLLPQRTPLPRAKEILEMVIPEQYESHTFKSKVAEWLSELQTYKNGARDWLLVDRRTGKREVIIPFVPVCRLTQQGD
jgi:hypothetical protein